MSSPNQERRAFPAASEPHLQDDSPIPPASPISSPIHRLSDDALVLIFSELLCSSVDPPWESSAVCRRWRELAISCPLLWSYIELHARGITANPQLYYSRIDVQLARTALIPLEKITLALSEDTPASDRTAQRLLQHLHKTKVLHLEGDVNKDLLPDQPPDFRFLTELRIFHESWMKPGLFQYTPALKRLRLECLAVQQPFALQWGNLVQLVLLSCDISVGHLLSILDLTPHLAILRIFDTFGYREEQAIIESDSTRRPNAVASLERLAELDIRNGAEFFDMSQLQTQTLLGHLLAPNLEELTIVGAVDGTIEGTTHFIRTFPNGCNIHDLLLENLVMVHVHPILDLLKELPGLQVLYLGSFADDYPMDPVLRALEWPSETDDTGHLTRTVPRSPNVSAPLRLCPELNELLFSGGLMTAAVLVNTVKSRIPAFPGDKGNGLLPYFLEKLELLGVSFVEGDANRDLPPAQELVDAAQLGLLQFDAGIS